MPIQQGLLTDRPAIINIGAKMFAEEIAAQGVDVIALNWSAPLENEEMAQLLDDLL
ncbi:MAG: hypothetical protein LBO81_04515 [Clostridiales Family XIII bacterium]|jgi:hypothetical protein|nr:hypothetical protein [Clostridiales Family XIII bacterium]